MPLGLRLNANLLAAIRAFVGGGGGPGNGLLLEDNTSFLLLENGDFLLLE